MKAILMNLAACAKSAHKGLLRTHLTTHHPRPNFILLNSNDNHFNALRYWTSVQYAGLQPLRADAG